MSTVVIIRMGLCIELPTSWMPHAHILLAPTTLYYSAKDYQRPSLYAYCFYQVSQRGTSMPPVQRSKEIFLNFWTSIPGRQGKQTDGLLFFALSNSTTIILIRDWGFLSILKCSPCVTFVCMASVSGPMFFSNIYAYSNVEHDNPIYFLQDEHS